MRNLIIISSTAAAGVRAAGIQMRNLGSPIIPAKANTYKDVVFEAFYDSLDSNGDGVLQREEFRKLYNDLVPLLQTLH